MKQKKEGREAMVPLAADINRVYQGIQHLQVAPTKENVAILFDTMSVLEELYKFVRERTENAADGNDSGE